MISPLEKIKSSILDFLIGHVTTYSRKKEEINSQSKGCAKEGLTSQGTLGKLKSPKQIMFRRGEGKEKNNDFKAEMASAKRERLHDGSL